ncbi:MAG: glucose-1-phosphate thymidylyltransferase [Candidatus Xenobia bacterium]
MKGLVLAGGKGTRLRPLTFTRAKQLIPIANKPNLYYVIEDLVAVGVRDIGVIISPETGDEIRTALGSGERWGASITYIPQAEPRGLAHAVKTAYPYLQDSPFVMYLGDNLLNGGIGHLVEDFQTNQPDAQILLTPVENPSQFGVAVLDGEGRAVRLLEKPKEPPSNLALVGVYLFTSCIFDVIERLQPSRRGEYEITDAIQMLIDEGKRVSTHQVRGWWKDTGKADDLLEANRLVLSQLERRIEGTVEDSQILGQVVIEPGARVVRSTVRGPAHIAAGALIEESYIGPYSAVGRDARLVRSEIEYSLLLQEASLRNLSYRVDASVIGQGVTVEGASNGHRRNTLQLVLGDFSQVSL